MLDLKNNLFLSVQVSPASSVAQVRVENGVPVYRYRKEVIRCGEYFKESDNLAFTVTPQVLDHWVNSFKLYTNNGNKVTVPETHEAANTPSENRGWVLDMFRDGNSLYAIMDLYGEDAPKIAATNDVSIYSPAAFTDGKGVEYTRPITHVALCTNPVVPGLNKFEAIAASLSTSKCKEKSMNMSVLSAALGLEFGPDDNEAAKEKKVTDAIDALKKKKDEEEADPVAAAQASEDDKKKAEEEAAKKKAMAASRGRKVDPLVVSLTADNRRMKIDGLLSNGKITPVVHKDLITQYVENTELAASLAQDNNSFDAVMSVLAKNDVVELSQKSPAQLLELSDPLKNGAKNPLLADAETRSKK